MGRCARACETDRLNGGMPFKYRLDFGARILIGKEAEIAIGERLIRCEKDAEFLDDRGETFGKQPWGNEGGGQVAGPVIRDHTQVQRLHVVFLDKVKEGGQMGEQNAEIVIVGTALFF